jgi:hypothetical protein
MDSTDWKCVPETTYVHFRFEDNTTFKYDWDDTLSGNGVTAVGGDAAGSESGPGDAQ